MREQPNDSEKIIGSIAMNEKTISYSISGISQVKALNSKSGIRRRKTYASIKDTKAVSKQNGLSNL